MRPPPDLIEILPAMNYLPIFMKLPGQRCLVIGGGEVAARKVGSLLRAQGSVTVISPELGAELSAWVEGQRVTHVRKYFDPADIKGFNLVISATNRRDVNESVAASARQLGIPVNVVDCPELCSFIFPAIVDRSPVVIAVSTGGASPVLARLVRARLETALPAAYGRLANLAESCRLRVKKAIPNGTQRRRFWEATLQGGLADLIFSGRDKEAQLEFDRLLEAESNGTLAGVGFVSLVGAGPGDPDLLTLKALRTLQEADVIVYDRLVSPEVMRLSRTDAEKINAGKASSRHTLPQEEINQLLVRLAREGKKVVRLKGGDPFIFGRGGEEIETLMAEGIPFQIVPGVTAATGCAAYSGIPLTHRDYAQSVAFVTGHSREGLGSTVDWEKLVNPQQTLVVYMGLQALPQIRDQLITHGCEPTMPAAIIEQGTTPGQRVVTGTLGDLYERATAAGIESPALIIIGRVVELQLKLAWFQGSVDPV
jgi:uroporphyrin-III C-methyltransferase/precorrin-2 dehydrogenase/sirohydrochlorin ferrochelatase